MPVALSLMLAAGAPALLASNLNLHVLSGGQPTVTVGPGQSVSYAVQGELTDNLNDGLAMFSIDLSFSGGPLAQASAPATSPMVNFDPPAGLTNPAGYGGTPTAGVLVQVGGAQNTINNSLAPFPGGTVVTGVAAAGSPLVLVSGNLLAPYHVGTFLLTPSGLMANVIRQGETGVPFWRVDAAGAGTMVPLSVTVQALTPGAPTVVVGQPVLLHLDAGPANAGHRYQVLGCTTPGAPNPRLIVPLRNDAYYKFTQMNPNSAILQNSLGQLDGQGKGTAIFTPTAAFVGQVFHAFFVDGTSVFVSNAATVQVTSSLIRK